MEDAVVSKGYRAVLGQTVFEGEGGFKLEERVIAKRHLG